MKSIQHEAINGIPALTFDTGLDPKGFAQTKAAALITLPGWVVSPEGTITGWKVEGVIERGGRMLIWGRDFPGFFLPDFFPDSFPKPPNDLLKRPNDFFKSLDHFEKSPNDFSKSLDHFKRRSDDLQREKDDLQGKKDEPQGKKEKAPQEKNLDVLRFWISAQIALLEKTKTVESPPLPYPIGALIAADGTLLFPPEPLVRQAVEAESAELWRDGAERWAHPDLTGLDAAYFTAGALAYRIFAGAPPFPNENRDVLRQDIREQVFFPLHFGAPGLEPRLRDTITRALEQKPADAAGVSGLAALRDCLGPPESAPAEAYIHPTSPEEQAKLDAALEKFKKKQRLRVKTKRFVARNAAILGVCAAALIVAALVVRSFAVAKAGQPTTKGLTPIEVLETYYTAIGNLDHALMEACVAGKAGKGDVEMVVNYFVLSKVRQAYEGGAPGFVSAQEWLDAGSPPVNAPDITVFGVSDLRLRALDPDESDGEVSFQAEYLLWHPESERDTSSASAPQYLSRTDTVRLSLQKGLWHITHIERNVNE